MLCATPVYVFQPRKILLYKSVYVYCLYTVEERRLHYMMDVLTDTHQGMPHPICRDNVYEDGMNLFRQKQCTIVNEYPFRIRYTDERAYDTGGVARDFFTAFWEDAFVKHFDGGSLFVPSSHAQVDLSVFPTLGSILSFGYMTSGCVPTKIAFPTLCGVFLGPLTTIPDEIILDSFVDYICLHDSTLLREAIRRGKGETQFSGSFQTSLINALSRFGARENPSPSNITRLVVEVARHELVQKPACAVMALHSGLPKKTCSFLARLHC